MNTIKARLFGGLFQLHEVDGEYTLVDGHQRLAIHAGLCLGGEPKPENVVELLKIFSEGGYRDFILSLTITSEYDVTRYYLDLVQGKNRFRVTELFED